VAAQQYTCDPNPVAGQAAARAATLARSLGDAARASGDHAAAFDYYERGGHFAAADRELIARIEAGPDDVQLYSQALSHSQYRSSPAFQANEKVRISVTGAYTPDPALARAVAAMPGRAVERALAAESAAFDEKWYREYLALVADRPEDPTDMAAIQQYGSRLQALHAGRAADPLQEPLVQLSKIRNWEGAVRDNDLAAALAKLRADRAESRATLLMQKYAGAPRLLQSVEANPLTIVRAPGGSGKTVLLSQLAAGIGNGNTRKVLWVALDDEDNDANRFFATLCRAVVPLGLTWEVDPQALAATAATSKAQLRAALAAFVNALCTTAAERVVVVLDDLHRLDHPDVFGMLEALLERLPDHVAVLIGTRVEPQLSLARWRAHGELVELGPADLRFQQEEAHALAQRKLTEGADPELVRRALERSDGWAVGLSMLLQAAKGAAGENAADLERGGSHALLAEGAIGTVERWFEQIPEAERRADPHVAYLNGTCGWLRWDWVRAKLHLPPAIVGLTQPQELPRRVRALFQLVDALNSAGELDEAQQRLDEVSKLPLDDLGHAQLALQRAWCLAPGGDNQRLVAHMQEFVDYTARDPERICPVTAGLIHCLLVGNPGVADTFERFVALAEQVRKPVARPWHLPLHAVDGWSRVWRGDRAGAEAAMSRAGTIYRQFRGLRVMSERYAQFRTLLGGVTGELAAMDAVAREMIGALQAPELSAHRPVWERAYRHAHARMHWIHGSPAWATLSQPLLAGDWRGAIQVLEAILDDYERLRLPMVYPDPRVSLAFAQLRNGDPAAAWRTFEPVYIEATDHHGVGILLMDSRRHVAELLDIAPAAVRSSAAMLGLKATLKQWAPRESAAPADDPAGGVGGVAGQLSEREREVLELVASGASNKHIARALDLSLHTVKRHVCNILDKLDCDSRGQAADLFRRSLRA
jgi:DNA-binding CsgD family transcriptional regulator